MGDRNDDRGNDHHDHHEDHVGEQIISDNVHRTAGRLRDDDFQHPSSSAYYNDAPAGPPRDYKDDDDDRSSSAAAVDIEEDDDEEMDLMSLAAGSVVSMTESVMTGIKTSLSHWKIILFGQILALLMGLRGASTAFLYLECNIMAPTFQLWWIYLLLSFNLIIHIASAGNSNNMNQRSRNSGIVFDLSILHDRPKMSPQRKTYYMPLCGDLVKLHTPWYNYLLLSLLDLEGNYFTYLALKYTSLKSASLLDTLSIPTAMLASYMCLRKVYSCAHLVGAFICLVGALVMIFADYSEEQDELSGSSNNAVNSMEDAYSGMTLEEVVYAEEHNNNQGATTPYQDETDLANSYPNTFPDYYNTLGGGGGSSGGGDYYNDNPAAASTSSVFNSRTVQGDILAAVGGICWGLKDTMSEGTLQRSSRTEFLGMIGFFGFLIASLQTAILESVIVKDFFNGFANAPYDTCSSKETYGVFFAMIAIFVLYYLGNARFLNMSEAALLQLSLLASDLYAVLFSVIEEHKLPTWMFVVSMILILFGVGVYESVPAPFTRDARTFGAYVQSPTRERKRYQSTTDNEDQMYYDDTKYGDHRGVSTNSNTNGGYRYNGNPKGNGGSGVGGGSPDTMLSEEDRRHLDVLGIDDDNDNEEELSFEQSLAEIELSNPYGSPTRDHPPSLSTTTTNTDPTMTSSDRRPTNGTSAPSEFEII